MAKDTHDRRPGIIDWSYGALRERLAGGESPRDRGGEDGRRNYPPAGSAVAAVYQRDVVHRAEELAQQSEEAAQDALQELAGDIRENPFLAPGSGPGDRCEAVAGDAVRQIEHLVGEQAGELNDLRGVHETAGRHERRDFQAAGGQPPRGGWKSRVDFWLVAIIVISLEAVISFLMLRKQLGPSMALLSGIGAPAISFALGYGAGHLFLLPSRKEDRTSGPAWVRRATGVLAALLTVAIVYVLAAWRACLIAGQDANPLEIWRIAQHPMQVLLQWEALALAAIGLIGFAAGSYKAHEFWGGFAPPLRRAGRAREKASEALRGARDGLVELVKAAAEAAERDLVELLTAARAWAKATGDRADRASAEVLELNRRRDLLQRAAEAVDLDYREGNLEVRSEPAPIWPEAPFIGRVVEPAEAFERARAAANDTARAWAEATRHAQDRVAAAREEAIRRIDGLCGFRPPAGAPAPILPRRTV